MKLKDIISVSGKWFVMLRNEDMPEACDPHPIAAWAVMVDEQDQFEVLPLIAPKAGYARNTLIIPDEEEVVGIADESEAHLECWQDEAAALARLHEEEEEKKAATEEAATHAVEHVLAKVARATQDNVTKDDIVERILDVRDRRPYMINDPLTDAMREEGILREAEGGFHMTKLADVVMKKYR